MIKQCKTCLHDEWKVLTVKKQTWLSCLGCGSKCQIYFAEADTVHVPIKVAFPKQAHADAMKKALKRFSPTTVRYNKGVTR